MGKQKMRITRAVAFVLAVAFAFASMEISPRAADVSYASGYQVIYYAQPKGDVLCEKQDMNQYRTGDLATVIDGSYLKAHDNSGKHVFVGWISNPNLHNINGQGVVNNQKYEEIKPYLINYPQQLEIKDADVKLYAVYAEGGNLPEEKPDEQKEGTASIWFYRSNGEAAPYIITKQGLATSGKNEYEKQVAAGSKTGYNAQEIRNTIAPRACELTPETDRYVTDDFDIWIAQRDANGNYTSDWVGPLKNLDDYEIQDGDQIRYHVNLEGQKNASYQIKYFKNEKEAEEKVISRFIWENDTMIPVEEGDIDYEKYPKYQLLRTEPEAVGNAVAKGSTIRVYYGRESMDLSKLSLESYIGMYDGKAHFAALKGLEEDAEVEISYRLKGGEWKPNQPFLKNVVDNQAVEVKVTEAFTRSERILNATVTITKRPITVFTESATKVYDGEILTKFDGAGFKGKVAEGDKVLVTATGSQTDIGKSINGYVAVVTNGKENVTANYQFNETLGELTVLSEVTYNVNEGEDEAPEDNNAYEGAEVSVIQEPIPGSLIAVKEQPKIQSKEEKVPLSNSAVDNHKCCILHLLILLLALIVEIGYTKSMKRRQKEIFERNERRRRTR